MSYPMPNRKRKKNSNYEQDFVQNQSSNISSRRNDNESCRKKRIVFCPSCDKSFPSIMTADDMIKYHMLHTSCKKDLHECINCSKYFISLNALNQHLQCKSNTTCHKIYLQSQKKISYVTSKVEVKRGSSATSIPEFCFQSTNDSFANTPTEIIYDHSKSNISKMPFQHNTIKTSKIDKKLDDCLSSDDSENVEECNNIITDFISENSDNIEPISDNSVKQSYTDNSNDNIDYFPIDHFINIHKILNEEISLCCDDSDYTCSLSLIKLLIEKKISLSLYDDFMKWKSNDEISNKRHLSLDKVIQISTQKIYGKTLANLMSPKVVPIKLTSGRRCHMITFDSSSMIFDLLNNKNLTCSNNMIFSGEENNPFTLRNKNYFDDIDSSSVYQKTVKDLKLNCEKEILCPISLFIDELKLDAFGKMGLEPVVMTLMIYNRATRNHHKAH